MEEKIIKYQNIILDFLNEQANYRKAASSSEIQLISDKSHNHYQLLRIGWKKDHFSHLCLFHFDIKDGKIWIQQNRTDVEVAEVFIEKGVSYSDIVLGFLPSEMRVLSNYAVS